jgi:hypothetical protein
LDTGYTSPSDPYYTGPLSPGYQYDNPATFPDSGVDYSYVDSSAAGGSQEPGYWDYLNEGP